ncbi:conserved phage C-terminal domain-containing protein [Erysipelothrix rhusiopathiae]|uniref:conserved phage C-terminal domain-containing protein n=1 Tax=Erysipelothrix rhusiopathiae TaxID=1648 RepID=UPI003AB06E04
MINYLNNATGSSYRPDTKNTVKLLKAALKNYTVDELKKLIDNMVQAWTGTEYQPYLRPNTLFKEDKIEQYLNWKPIKEGVSKNAKSRETDKYAGMFDSNKI